MCTLEQDLSALADAPGPSAAIARRALAVVRDLQHALSDAALRLEVIAGIEPSLMYGGISPKTGAEEARAALRKAREQ